jgi:hypothetical protein
MSQPAMPGPTSVIQKTATVFQDLHTAGTLGVFVAFLIVIVFPHTIHPSISRLIKSSLGKSISLLAVFIITYCIGPMAGLFSAMAFLFIWTLPKPDLESFQDKARIVPDKHKWFVEKVLYEDPLIIEDELVKTQPIQDNSDNSMANSRVSM